MSFIYKVEDVFIGQEAVDIIILMDKINDDKTHFNLNKYRLWKHIAGVTSHDTGDGRNWQLHIDHSIRVLLQVNRFQRS